MLLWADHFRAVFWVAAVPGWLAVALLVVGLREPRHERPQRRSNPISRATIRRLPRAYWWVVGLGAVFTLSRFSEAFLVLRAQQDGIPIAFVPLLLVAMNVIYAACAYPFGRLSDRVPHAALLGMGIVVLLAADLVLARNTGWAALFVGVALWGVHMGMTQGLLAAMVADASPAELRGTAFGVFNLASGVAMLVASTVAGVLWQGWGAASTFYAGALFCLVSLAALAYQRARGAAPRSDDAASRH